MTPLERAAKAYYEARHPAGDAPAGGFTRWATWDEACQAQGFLAEQIVALRAALQELREPDEGMLQAACDATWGPTPTPPAVAHKLGWQAVIDYLTRECAQ